MIQRRMCRPFVSLTRADIRTNVPCRGQWRVRPLMPQTWVRIMSHVRFACKRRTDVSGIANVTRAGRSALVRAYFGPAIILSNRREGDELASIVTAIRDSAVQSGVIARTDGRITNTRSRCDASQRNHRRKCDCSSHALPKTPWQARLEQKWLRKTHTYAPNSQGQKRVQIKAREP